VPLNSKPAKLFAGFYTCSTHTPTSA
jgi:hypothetical protein